MSRAIFDGSYTFAGNVFETVRLNRSGPAGSRTPIR